MSKTGIIILVSIISAIIIFLIILLIIRNKLVNSTEEIKKAKSDLRVAKSKYISTLKKTVPLNSFLYQTESEAKSKLGNISNLKTLATFSGSGDNDIHKMQDNFDKSTSLIGTLEYEYRTKQQYLNNITAIYNKFIKRFPVCIFALILRYKPMEYIDEENLDLSTNLSIDDEDLL